MPDTTTLCLGFLTPLQQAFHASFSKRGVGALELLAVEMKVIPPTTPSVAAPAKE